MKKCCEYINEYKTTGLWDNNTIQHAAENGHLECMKYAYENGCPWHERTT